MRLLGPTGRFTKKGRYVKCTGKYYYWCYLDIKLPMLALPVVPEKKKKAKHFISWFLASNNLGGWDFDLFREKLSPKNIFPTERFGN